MSKTRFDILASAAQTATGQGGGISVGGIKNLLVLADVTVNTGTLSCIYLQGSSDGGTTWYDLLAATKCCLTSGSGTATTGSNIRNIMSDSLQTGNIQKIAATYSIIGDYIRAAWVITGAAPSCTFSVKGIGEN